MRRDVSDGSLTLVATSTYSFHKSSNFRCSLSECGFCFVMNAVV